MSKIVKITQVGEEWTDDRIPCVTVEVEHEDGTTKQVDLMWCGSRIVGAVEYSQDCSRALQDVVTFIEEMEE